MALNVLYPKWDATVRHAIRRFAIAKRKLATRIKSGAAPYNVPGGGKDEAPAQAADPMPGYSSGGRRCIRALHHEQHGSL